MKKIVALKPEDKRKIVEGVDILADAVGMTLGARARNVALTKVNGRGEVYERAVIDDGVSIAREIELEDELQQIGVSLVRESAQKQVDACGDGTTATIVLARAIIREAEKHIAQGRNPMEIRAELEEDLKAVLPVLDKLSVPLKTYAQKKEVATISSKDEELGAIIADTFEKMGLEGVITTEKTRSATTFTEYQAGMRLDKGYASPYFITDPERMTSHLEGSKILVTDIDINSITDIVPFLEEYVNAGGRLLTIIAPSFGPETLATFIQNKIEGKLLSLLINAPSFGDNQKQMLSDIAVLTGATLVSSDTGMKLSEMTQEVLGEATVTATATTAVVTQGAGSKRGVSDRLKQLRSLLKEETSDFAQEKLKERIAKLSSGVAVIKVGGATEVEMKERRERVIDAVAAVRSAMRSGIVAGGEVIFLSLRDNARGILHQALKAPFYQLLDNAGIDIAETGYNITSPAKHTGIDVLDGKVKNMIEAGIIDPVEVPRNALINAVSVAISVMLIGGAVVPVKHEMPKL